MHNPWNHFLETAIPIQRTPHPAGIFLSAKALGPQIHAGLHFWGIFWNICKKPFCAKFSLAFVRVPLDTVRVFLGGEKLPLIKLVPTGRQNFVSWEENCKLRKTFFCLHNSHPFIFSTHLTSSSNDWIFENDWFTPSDNILWGGAWLQRLPPHCSGGLNSLQWPPDISPSPRSYHQHYAGGLSIWDSFQNQQCFRAVPASRYIAGKVFSVRSPQAGASRS